MPRHRPAAPAPRGKPIKLALQGGGAHGAFTWGVLDEILADGRLDITAVSGASAGAMNAVILADGLADGGPARARAQLERFWRKASLDGALPDFARPVFDTVLNFWSPRANPWLGMLQTASPYDFNPLNINPLKTILDEEIDFARLRTASPVRLAIAATNTETGKVRVFREGELTADHIAASACLPQVFRAVEIDGTPYWDGGYMGNPPLYPLFEGEGCDLLLIQINPVRRPGAPVSATAIQHRINEISFNSPLLHELRAIEFVARLIDTGVLTDPHYKRILMHRIAMSETHAETAETKMSTEFGFFLKLRNAGRTAAKAWLKAHYDDIGTRETMDLRAEFA